MKFPADQVDELRAFAREVLEGEEAGITYLLLLDAKLPSSCTPTTTNLLLCPAKKDGYDTRLYFRDKPTSRNAPNWAGGTVCILDKDWWVYSWKVPSGTTLRPAQMVAAHLQALA